MKREWKPGDVVRQKSSGGRDVTYVRTKTAWNGVDEYGETYTDRQISNPRPLVVIDPENREQVERLAALYVHQPRTALRTSNTSDDMQAALREFANPTPPKPDEPTGLGAVVEDADYTRWTRVESGEAETRNPWYPAHDPSLQPAEWSDITVVRVLSEGVHL